MPFAPKNTKGTDLIVGKLGVRRSTARVYASTLAMVAREKEDSEDLTWLKKKKVLKFVSCSEEIPINDLRTSCSMAIAGIQFSLFFTDSTFEI